MNSAFAVYKEIITKCTNVMKNDNINEIHSKIKQYTSYICEEATI